MKINISITDAEKTVKLIEKINSLTEELRNAITELQEFCPYGTFEITSENKKKV